MNCFPSTSISPQVANSFLHLGHFMSASYHKTENRAQTGFRALTIDAYWAWAIIHGGKCIENRTWRTNYRGELWIHAGRTTRRDDDAIAWLKQHAPEALPDSDAIDSIRGTVCGRCRLVDCFDIQDAPTSKWAAGPVCWLLGSIEPVTPPVPLLGRQGLWTLPDDASRRLAR